MISLPDVLCRLLGRCDTTTKREESAQVVAQLRARGDQAERETAALRRRRRGQPARALLAARHDQLADERGE